MAIETFTSSRETAVQQFTRREIILQRLPEGFLPKEHPIYFGEALKVYRAKLESIYKPFFADRTSSRRVSSKLNGNGHTEGSRELYSSLKKDEELKQMQERVTNFGVFNVIYNENGQVENINIHDEEHQNLNDYLTYYLRKLGEKGKIKVIAPFKREQNTVKGVLDYCVNAIGANNVVAVESGHYHEQLHLEAIGQARQSEATIISQTEVLKGVNWQRLTEMKIIPPGKTDEESAQQLDGSKGLTMLAGIVHLHAKDQEARKRADQGLEYNSNDILDDDTFIAFHDTDITNPNEYAALHYLTIAIAFSPSFNTYRSVQIAKTGTERNNETVINAANAQARAFPNEVMNGEGTNESKLGHVLQPLIWFLTGERAIQWKYLKESLMTNGMSIETTLNVSMGAFDVEDEYRGMAQVVNPNPKLENAVSQDTREYGMIFDLDHRLRLLGECVQETLPRLWGADHFGQFNYHYGELPTFDAVPNHKFHRHPEYIGQKTDYLLPPVIFLDKMGIIDTEYIANLKHTYERELLLN